MLHVEIERREMSIAEEKYRALTNVDIEEQKRLWDERGKGYYGEYMVFKELFSDKSVPGFGKILMNLQIPTPNGKSTEIDLLLIHETGLYVFEVKHYKGTIYGKVNDRTWTQYFRTESNQTFRNPVEQNQYHIAAIGKMYPQIPVHSFIVFTNGECDLRVECNVADISVCTLRHLWNEVSFVTAKKNQVMDMNQINAMFEGLKVYSPIVQNNVVVSDQQIPFYDYIHKIVEEQKSALKQNSDRLEKQIECNNKVVKQTKISAAVICVLMLACCVMVSGMIWKSCTKKVEMIRTESEGKIEVAQAELREFAHRFERVEEFNNGDITLSETLIEVTDVMLENSKDVVDTAKFSCVLNWSGEEYGIRLVEDTKYIVILEDGSAKEYDLFGAGFLYTTVQRIGKGHYQTFQLPTSEFYGVDAKDIAYIKLVDVNIWKDGVKFGQDLFTGYEIELYCK